MKLNACQPLDYQPYVYLPGTPAVPVHSFLESLSPRHSPYTYFPSSFSVHTIRDNLYYFKNQTSKMKEKLLALPNNMQSKDTPLSVGSALAGLRSHIRHQTSFLRYSNHSVDRLNTKLAGLKATLSTLSLKRKRRANLIDIDVLVTIITAAVMTINDIDRLINYPPSPRVNALLNRNANRVETISSLIAKLVVTLSISSRQAAEARADLVYLVTDMLQSDLSIAARLAHLQDYHHVTDQLPKVPSDPPAYHSPPDKDERPPQYGLEEGSVAIQPRNWSVYSGYTLADIPKVDMIAIPILLDEVKHPQYY